MSRSVEATHTYRNDFFDYIGEGSGRSAQIVVPLVHRLLGSSSVLDVGCGRGMWLRQWRAVGVSDITGVDGDYVAKGQLVIPAERFIGRDLSQPFALDRRFDLVQCLEVAEHVAEKHAETFVANLVAHGDIVMFSAAIPGQGGEMHVNEQPYSYWQRKFAARGFRLFDWLRPRIFETTSIEPWYRYNTFLFAHDRVVGTLPHELVQTEIPLGRPIPDFAPLTWRLRTGLLRLIPQGTVHHMARLKHQLMLARRRAVRHNPPSS